MAELISAAVLFPAAMREIARSAAPSADAESDPHSGAQKYRAKEFLPCIFVRRPAKPGEPRSARMLFYQA